MGSFDRLRWPVDTAMLDTLLADDPDEASLRRVRDTLDQAVQKMAADRAGAVILTGLPADAQVARAILVRVSRLLGAAMPQNREGELVREVRDRGSAIGEGE